MLLIHHQIICKDFKQPEYPSIEDLTSKLWCRILCNHVCMYAYAHVSILLMYVNTFKEH